MTFKKIIWLLSEEDSKLFHLSGKIIPLQVKHTPVLLLFATPKAK